MTLEKIHVLQRRGNALISQAHETVWLGSDLLPVP